MTRREDAVPDAEFEQIKAWNGMLADAMGATGGSLTADERAWADDALGTVPP